MSVFSTLAAAWRVTVEGSRALSSARAAYARGEPVASIVQAWAASTETPVDDELVESLTALLTRAINVAQRVALLLVRVALRLEMQAPTAIRRFGDAVAWLDAKVPPLLARLRAAADRAHRASSSTRDAASRASVAASQLAAALGRLKGDP